MLIESFLTNYLHRVNDTYLRLETGADWSLPPPRPDHPYLLYVHIPFCEELCPYCSFHRVKLDRPVAAAYFKALRSEIKRLQDDGYDFSSVYVGGGTPTVMPEELAETLSLIRRLYSVEGISVETNPNHLEDDVLAILQAAGVNRLSVGVQSFDDARLKEMNRYHKYGSGSQIVEGLTNSMGWFDTLNADMIFNLPHQTLASLERDIQILTEQVKVDQVTFYPLMSSPDTRRQMEYRMGDGSTPQREKLYYQKILEGLGADYRPSSAWCFSRNAAMIDEYIVTHLEYVGVGSGSFSYLDAGIYSSTFSIGEYIDRIRSGKSSVTAKSKYNLRQEMQYEFMMGFFGLEVDGRALEAKYKGFFRKMWKEFLFFKMLGAVEQDGHIYRLTERGMYYWVIMMREFFTGVNNFRDQMRSGLDLETDEGQTPIRVK